MAWGRYRVEDRPLSAGGLSDARCPMTGGGSPRPGAGDPGGVGGGPHRHTRGSGQMGPGANAPSGIPPTSREKGPTDCRVTAAGRAIPSVPSARARSSLGATAPGACGPGGPRLEAGASGPWARPRPRSRLPWPRGHRVPSLPGHSLGTVPPGGSRLYRRLQRDRLPVCPFARGPEPGSRGPEPLKNPHFPGVQRGPRSKARVSSSLKEHQWDPPGSKTGVQGDY